MENQVQSANIFENLLFVRIFQSFRMAIQPGKLIIAFCAVCLLFLAGWILDFSNSVAVDKSGVNELQIYTSKPQQIQQFIEENKNNGYDRGVFSTLWDFAATKLHASLASLFSFDIPGVFKNIGEYFRAVGWAIRYHFVYSIIFFLIKLALISLVGGAICRMASLQFGRGEKPGIAEAMRFSKEKFVSFFAAPLVPVGVIIVIGLVFVFSLGLIGNIPWVGEVVIGLSMPLILLVGAFIAVVLIGAVAGFSLMFPAIAYDGTDCLDAVGRSLNYVYAKPWRMGFYTTVAVLYGAICYVFVRFFCFLLLCAGHLFLELGIFTEAGEGHSKLAAIWAQPTFVNLFGSAVLTPANWSQSFAAFLAHLCIVAVVGLLLSFIISFYFTVNTIIYSLMRYGVDNAAIDDVYTHFEDSSFEPTDAD